MGRDYDHYGHILSQLSVCTHSMCSINMIWGDWINKVVKYSLRIMVTGSGNSSFPLSALSPDLAFCTDKGLPLLLSGGSSHACSSLQWTQGCSASVTLFLGKNIQVASRSSAHVLSSLHPKLLTGFSPWSTYYLKADRCLTLPIYWNTEPDRFPFAYITLRWVF